MVIPKDFKIPGFPILGMTLTPTPSQQSLPKATPGLGHHHPLTTSYTPTPSTEALVSMGAPSTPAPQPPNSF